MNGWILFSSYFGAHVAFQLQGGLGVTVRLEDNARVAPRARQMGGQRGAQILPEVRVQGVGGWVGGLVVRPFVGVVEDAEAVQLAQGPLVEGEVLGLDPGFQAGGGDARFEAEEAHHVLLGQGGEGLEDGAAGPRVRVGGRGGRGGRGGGL